MPNVTDNIEFDVLGREWRLKWATKKDAAACQTALATVLPKIKAIEGVNSVDRVVCGGHHDFKVIIACDHSRFESIQASLAPLETQFREEVEALEGVFSFETQVYTLVRL